MVETTRAAVRWLLMAASLAVGPAVAQQPGAPADVTIGYVEISGDPRYDPIRAYERLILKTREHPFPGAQIGLDEAKALSRVLKFGFSLDRIAVQSPAEVAGAVVQALQTRGIHYFLVDAPAEVLKPLAEAVRGKDVLLFNVSAADDELRRNLCATEFVHAIPSLAMRMDALMQYLVSRKWRDILVLEGPLPADTATANALERSAKKFGARVVARQKFKVGTDPRERDLNNPLLLTSGRDYDVVFVADDAFDFVRQVPFRTQRARPVVGSIDLEPVAWHWTWEHNGAPQVNARFEKLTGGRHMEGADWAAWISVKMVVKAAVAARSSDFSAMRQAIFGSAGFDGDKGLAVSVRPWDHQVRQAVLLATPWAVIASAPVEGFLHRLNELDSLGDDEPETPCHLNK